MTRRRGVKNRAPARSGIGAQISVGVAQPTNLRGEPQQRRSTAKLTSSASLSLGTISTRRRHRAICGEPFNMSSVFTYGGVATVSRSAVTN
jgi:hypothetical protein